MNVLFVHTMSFSCLTFNKQNTRLPCGMLLTRRFHLLAQNSTSEIAMKGSSKYGSNTTPNTKLAMALGVSNKIVVKG